MIGPVEVGPVAHGGHCVARHEGRVIFVRHALPGERVMVQVTDDRHDRFWRADAVEILVASPDRVEPPCPIAGPGLCGGCDFQHAALPAQRSLKAAVVAEQLRRLAGIEWTGEVVEVSTPDTADGLHWRTRMRYVTDDAGRVGLRAHRSHRVVPLPPGGCRIAAPGALTGDEGVVTEVAAGRRWAVDAAGFWQVHPAAADTLVRAVMDGLRPVAGERALDLYAGVGLFAGALADAGCRVWAVEGSRPAAKHARQNLADVADRVTVRRWSGRAHSAAAARPGGPGGAGPAAHRGRPHRHPGGGRPPPPRRGVRGLRPRRAGPRPRHRRGPRLPRRRDHRVRPVPDDPPRGVRGRPHAWICYARFRDTPLRALAG